MPSKIAIADIFPVIRVRVRVGVRVTV